MSASLPYPVPANESHRLGVLHSTGILDTSPEEEYDELVALAATICGTPTALISLVDEARQWFKARVGFELPETPRTLSFCAHAIHQSSGDLFVVPDASRDARFASYDNVVGAPHIRFYAGAPLVTHDGAALGTLCVLDDQPHELTAEQARALRVLSRQLVNTLELRRLVATQRSTIQELESTQQKLQTARQAAEAATAAKGRFLAAVSHEIRTPLNAILGMTTVLSASDLSPADHDCADTIRSSGEILLGLVNDVLDLSKIESGRLELEHAPFALAPTVQRVSDCLQGLARPKQLQLEISLDDTLPAEVIGDAVRLQQILVNLVANAIKFTAAGRVRVAARLAPESTPQRPVLQFSVADSGIGIAPERLHLLFHDYAQADPSISRRYGGTGLGLSISKRLAELHGGRIWVESTPGEGSTFHFTLAVRPFTRTAQSAPLPTHAPFDRNFATAHPLRILVADDNPVNLKVISLFLARLGYDPTCVKDGVEALAQVHAQLHDLVFMDVEMPNLDGAAASARIRRELPVDRQPRIVALTAHFLDDENRAILLEGMDDYLAKPIRLEQLTDVLERASAARSA